MTCPLRHVPTYSTALAWLALLGERHPLHDGCRALFEPTFHDVACVTVERVEGLAVVRLRTLPRAAADMVFWSGGRLLSPGPDDVTPLPHALFEAPLADAREFFAALDLSGPDADDSVVRDGMPTTTSLWRAGHEVARRRENLPQGQHLLLVRRVLDLAVTHLPAARACLTAVRRYLE